MERLLICFVLVLGLSYATIAPLKRIDRPIADQYIVVLKDSGNVDRDREALTDITGVSVRQEYRRALKGFGVRVTSETALNQIRRLTDVAYVQQDGNVTLFETSMTWGLDRIDQRNLPLDGQSSFSGNGTGVNVYVIDSGIYTQHEYFEGRARFGYDAGGDGEGDCYGHGTHCAGTIGANHYGVARGATIWAVRIASCSGNIYWSWIIDGIDWVANHRILPAVASLSLGGSHNDAVDQAMQGLYGAGVVAAVAAGNSNNDACTISPAGAPWSFTVGATEHRDHRAYFSSYGSCLDIFAPGVNVLSTMIGSPRATAISSGTSMAAPHVAGAMAVALGNDPNMTPKEVWEKLKADSTSGVLQDKGALSPDRLLYVP
ncbi:aqualysin-1-like [Amphiura filiformis]|uniref:aqualysin-1-like n=1 Tax=Amphiura filiformis TaxID=82378 RepID=UPI003B21D36E